MWSTSPRRVKVRHLTSVHNVHDSRILRRERKSLAQAEHDVALVVGRPPREDVDGVRIVGVGAATNRFHRAFRVTWNIIPRGEARASGCLPVPRPELLWVGLLLKLQDHKVVYDVYDDVPKQIRNTFWGPRGCDDRSRWWTNLPGTLARPCSTRSWP